MRKRMLFILALSIPVFILYKTVQAQNLNYSIQVKDYEYDINTHKSKNYGEIFLTNNVSKGIEVILGFIKPGNDIYMATNGYLDLEQKLENYINKNYNSKETQSFGKSKFFSKYTIYLRPVLDKRNKIKDVLLAIERRENIKDDEYRVNDFILTEKGLKNSKEFGYLKDGRSIDKVIKGDKHLKMLMYQTPDKIYYVSFEFEIRKSKEKVSGNNNQQTFPINNTKTIKAPFYYDIKYQNSKGDKVFLDDVKQEAQFSVQVAKKDTINPVTKKDETLVYNLKGIILPVKYSSEELNIQLILTAESYDLNNNGNKSGISQSSYIREISFNPGDVVEVKLKENWPKMTTVFGYDPVTLKKYYYDYNIKNQSLFIKPVKK